MNQVVEYLQTNNINIINQYRNINNNHLLQKRNRESHLNTCSQPEAVSNCYIKHKTMEIVAVVRYSKQCLCSKRLENQPQLQIKTFFDIEIEKSKKLAISTTCAVHTEYYGDWCFSGCHNSVVEHRHFNLSVLVQLLATAGFSLSSIFTV